MILPKKGTCRRTSKKEVRKKSERGEGEVHWAAIAGERVVL